jgi:PmbA protein
MSSDSDLLEKLIQSALTQGADGADALMVTSDLKEMKRRLGNTEGLEASESKNIGLRVMVGQKQTIVSTTDDTPDHLDELVEHALKSVKLVPEDPYCGLATQEQICKDFAALDLYDETEPDTDQMIEQADQAEKSALAVEGITNSQGADSYWSKSAVHLMTSNGFSGSYASSNYGISACVLAGEGTGMERDYSYTQKRFFQDLPNPQDIGKEAGEKTVARLNPKRAPTKAVPIILDPRVAAGMLQLFASAANGSAIARKTSFIHEKMGQPIFNDKITIIDDPFIKRGLRSKVFDAEGLSPQKRTMVDQGVLQSWFLDLSSAKQLGLSSTGHASRGSGSLPSPSANNLFILPGELSPEAMIGEIEEGFYVTDMLGHGMNLVTGDYSRGASGFWIEKGEIVYPVSEMTIAGNLKDMWLNMDAANNLEHKYGIDTPTLRIDGMMVAGS